jgi:phosphoesterase RecJ-like protein
MESMVIADIRRALHGHRSFLVAGHEDLDGDCIGSQLGLYHWLAGQDKQVVVVSGGPTIANYAFLPGFDRIQCRVPDGFQADVTVCLDTGSIERVFPGAPAQGLVINIDHHTGNAQFGDINWVDTSAAAVGEQIFTLLNSGSRLLTPEIAACLYVAILTDTGSFHYSKTSARTFDIAAALVHAGADPHGIANAYYDNIHPDTVRMMGEVFNHLHFEMNGRLVWGEITQEMYARLGGVERQPEMLASQMRSIRGVEIAVLFHEMDGPSGRVSFRSRARVDAQVVASELGGGGHPSAAGCRFEGDYAPNRDRILEVVRRHAAALQP